MGKSERKIRTWHIVLGIFALLVIGVAVAYRQLSQPLPESAIPADYKPDIENGRIIYTAGGCISCHRGIGPHVELPAGGRKLKIPGGEITVPNITPDEKTGIGKWRAVDFLTALRRGLGLDGTHYIPAFPYTSYAWMTTKDILDLYHYLKTLAPVRNETPLDTHRFDRFALAFWKWLALPKRPFRPVPGKSEEWNRGAYLVLGPGHCGECHTPRNSIFIPDRRRWLAGAPHLSEKGHVPSLRGLKRRGRYKDVNDLFQALKYGESLGYEDISSGGMGEVQRNISKLPDADIRAIATYLMSLE